MKLITDLLFLLLVTWVAGLVSTVLLVIISRLLSWPSSSWKGMRETAILTVILAGTTMCFFDQELSKQQTIFGAILVPGTSLFIFYLIVKFPPKKFALSWLVILYPIITISSKLLYSALISIIN